MGIKDENNKKNGLNISDEDMAKVDGGTGYGSTGNGSDDGGYEVRPAGGPVKLTSKGVYND